MTFLQDVKVRPNYIYIKKTRARIPISFSFIKDFLVGYVFFLAIQAVRLRRALMNDYLPHKVGFLPQRPRAWYLLWNVCKFRGVRIVDDPLAADVLFRFDDVAHDEAGHAPHSAGRPIINGACTDIRKSRVAEAFEEAFGYRLTIDPIVHRGRAVCKSEDNGKHDGRIVVCPIEAREEGSVYQRVVNNSDDGATVEDLRAPVVGDRLPLVFVKRRPIEQRFANMNTKVRLARPEDVFTDDERARLLKLARLLGMDSGAFDVLRDRDDGRLYVVDANKTEMGPPITMKMSEKIEAIRRLSSAYAALFAAAATAAPERRE